MSYSTISKRFLANLIDSGLGLAINLVIYLLLGNGLFPSLLSIMVIVAYIIICEGGECHATVGKRIMKIMIVDESGNGIDFATSAKRYFGKILSIFTLYIGFIMALFNDEHRTLYDKIAKTYVVDGVVKKKKYRW